MIDFLTSPPPPPHHYPLLQDPLQYHQYRHHRQNHPLPRYQPLSRCFLLGFAQVASARELLLISKSLPFLPLEQPPPVPLSLSIMRKSSPPAAKKPSPTATPFVPASSDDTIPSSSSDYAGSTRLAALARVNLPPGQITCKFYVKGYCSRGTGCWYIHDAATVPVPMIVEEGGRKKVVEFREPKGKGKAACPIGQEAGIGESSLSLQRLGGRCSVSGLHTREIAV